MLFASLRERALDQTASAAVNDFDAALTHAAAVEYRLRRDAAFRRLKRRQRGVSGRAAAALRSCSREPVSGCQAQRWQL